MSEVNNNIPNFGRKIEKIEKDKNKNINVPKIQENNKEHAEYVQDTGVLGRSQIKKSKGADISKSVEEAAALAKNNPALLCGSEDIFDCIYNDCIKNGIEPKEAYIKALLAEDEFLKIGLCNK